MSCRALGGTKLADLEGLYEKSKGARRANMTDDRKGIFIRGLWTALVACAATLATAQDAADQTRPVPGTDGLSDALVQSAIESALMEARAIDANHIDVEVSQGVVTLTGIVDNLLARERAIRVASLTRGVASVLDHMTVARTNRSDEAIERDVEAALRADPATDSWEIMTWVDHGIATLTGTVQSQSERRLAERVAKTQRGVLGVTNMIDIDSDATRSDAELTSEIRALLDWDVRLAPRLLTVDVSDGKVVLAGSVGSVFERDLATTLAWVQGVTEIDTSQVEVEWWLRDEMRRDRVPGGFSDSQIREAIERALLVEPRVKSLDIETTVDNGTARLRGHVDNLKARQAAAQAARNTVGVDRVENLLKVRPDIARGDVELEADVRAALARSSALEGEEVAVVVDGSRVRLSGSVSSPFVRAHAADVAARVNGVTSVTNSILVTYGGPDYTYEYDDWDPLLYDYDYDLDYDYRGIYSKSDAEIRRDIEDELFWSPFVDANSVQVSVDDGVATLQGQVSDAYERRKASENALEGGAYRVRNQLTVGP
jgi:osmotically-inducible protein OsmY